MLPAATLRSDIGPDLEDNPSFAELLRYWEGKRRGRPMPARQDIDPIELKAHLGTLFLAEPLDGMIDFRYRLIGVGLTDTHGRDFTGKTVTDTFGGLDASYARSVIAAYRKVLRDGVVLRSRGPLVWVYKEYISFDSLHMPLTVGDGTPGMILGKLVFGARDSRSAG